ncbi:hypothetical protein HMF7854_09635 [Sphingomonas ginkgonis]|uniref:Peptidase MA-like domain-containing protein n=1 Tax=Sphingomonas ginkgonis TaxID=2315330 RepID=A0A3R9WSZ5_9SPHN|nr:hypothetical protein HMF7854_09635 [Sphingomonas ginkgonis]
MYAALALLLLSPLAVPPLLAFPYRAQVAGHAIYSEAPIDPRLPTLVHLADDKVRRSPLSRSLELTQPIFLTAGGWRWLYLANVAHGAFAFTRPLAESIVVNRSDVVRDEVSSTLIAGAHRSLSGVLAHEMTHTAIRARFGLLADWRFPAWLREGYCDEVAGGGSLSDDEAEQLVRSGQDRPALLYWRGRKQVEAELRANGGSVERLFAAHGAY